MTERRQRRTYSEEFKHQMVSLSLHLNGKPRAEILREDEYTGSAFDKWIKQFQSSRVGIQEHQD